MIDDIDWSIYLVNVRVMTRGRAVGRFPFRHVQISGSSIIEKWVHCRQMMLIKCISTVLLEIDVKLSTVNCHKQHIVRSFLKIHWAHLNIFDRLNHWQEMPIHSAHSIRTSSNNKKELWSIHRHQSPLPRNNRINLDLFSALFMRI